LSSGIECGEDLIAGLLGDGGGMSSEEGQSASAFVQYALEFLYQVLRQFGLLAGNIDGDEVRTAARLSLLL
jgi:hypothetical protein